MGENTKISWCDSTFNPWLGCTKVSAGCAHCYAETLMADRWGKVKWGPRGTRVKTSAAYWRKALSWNAAAEKSGKRIRVFPSLCDVFENWHGNVLNSKGEVLLPDSADPSCQSDDITLCDVRREFFELIDATPWIDWLLLTKRPECIRIMWPLEPGKLRPVEQPARNNVWLGVSVEDQESAAARIPALVKCRDLSPVLFVSYEPALEPVGFGPYLRRSAMCFCQRGIHKHGGPSIEPSFAMHPNCPECGSGRPVLDPIDWIIVGGESGPQARPFDVGWARSTISQCRSAGVACFVKQLGSQSDWFKDPKGGDWSEWPEDLRVREFPAVQPVESERE